MNGKKDLNKDSRIPLYYQLVDVLIAKIDAEELKENDILPSERELCDQFNISRATVRQAMQELEKEGHIYKIHGKGTFVSAKKLSQDLVKFYSFTEDMKKMNKVPTSKVIDFEISAVEEKIAKKMLLNKSDLIYRFTRLRLADNVPMMLETSYVPYNRFPGITREALESEPMYTIFSNRFGATMSNAEETFQVVSAREGEARLLGIAQGSPSMMIERVTFEKEHIIEYTIGIARGDRFKYHVSLAR